MAITNVTTTDTNDITIGAAGLNRVVLAVGTKGTTNDSTVTFNGVAPTGFYQEKTTYQSAIYYWLDADLPATAGTYTYTDSNLLKEALIYAEGVAQAAPTQTLITADVTTGGGAGAETERVVDLTSGANDDLRVFAMRAAGSLGANIVSGTTLISADESSSVVGYSQTANVVGFTSTLPPSAAMAALFPTSSATYTIDSIDGDNDVQAGQSNVDIVMTATTGVTTVTLGGETLTINGVT